MLQVNPSPEREVLGFEDAVVVNFRFLLDRGFQIVDRGMTFVRYESNNVFLNVFHGRASFELGVEIGRLHEHKEKINLFEVIAWAGATETEGLGKHVSFQVSSRDGVQQFVPKLALLVQKYSSGLLEGNDSVYREVKANSAFLAIQYEKEITLRSMREKAEAAWHGKDFKRVVELYTAERKDLSQVEARRLAYAEEHLSSSESNHRPFQAVEFDKKRS